jgi:hypothetical protein
MVDCEKGETMFGLNKLRKAAASAFGVTSWIDDLALQAPFISDETVAVTHAYRNNGHADPLFSTTNGYKRVEWLELRRNDSAGPGLISGDRPAFSFAGYNKVVCRDGTKLELGNLETVPAPANLDPHKYTLFRREARPDNPSLADRFLRHVKPGEVLYKTTIEKANLDLPAAMKLMRKFERKHPGGTVNDTLNPGPQHYAAITAPALAPV